MVLTINSFISILQTINVRGEGERGNLAFWLKYWPRWAPHWWSLCCHVWRSQSANGLPGPDCCAEVVCEAGGAGPGGGDTWPGQLQWPVALLSPGLSGLIGARHDTGPLSTSRSVQTWQIHLSQKCYIIEHQQMQIVHCVLNKHWSIFWLPVLFLLSIFDDVGYPK